MGLLILEKTIISSSFTTFFITIFLSLFTFSFTSSLISFFTFFFLHRNCYCFCRGEDNMSDINEFNIINTLIFFFIKFLSLFASLKRLNLKLYKILN